MGEFDRDEVIELVEVLEMLLEDFPTKVRSEMESIIKAMNDANTVEEILKIQDSLEVITNTANLDNYSRNEIMNVIAAIESIVNS